MLMGLEKEGFILFLRAWSMLVRLVSTGRQCKQEEHEVTLSRCTETRAGFTPSLTKSGANQLQDEEELGSWALVIPDCGFTRCSNQFAQQMSEPAWLDSQSTEFKTGTLARLLRCHHAGRVPVAGDGAWLLSELLKHR